MFSPSTLCRAALQLNLAARQMSVLSSPPRVKISLGQKIMHGVVMATSFSIVPAIVLLNLKDFKRR